MTNEPCSHFRVWRHHPDGTLHTLCTTCCLWGMQIMISGYGGSPDGPCDNKDYIEIMPDRPVFWDKTKKRQWFGVYCDMRWREGRRVSSEAYWESNLGLCP